MNIILVKYCIDLSIKIDIFNEAITIFKDVNSVHINIYKKE